MNLTNQFKLIGDIEEARISIFASYIKSTWALKIDNHTPVTISHFVSRKYNPDGYAKMDKLINAIQTKYPSYVYTDNNNKIFKLNGSNQRLFAIGNLSTDGKRLFFNADYIEIADENIKNFIDIRLDGQWIDDSHMLTIQNDRPLVFNIKRVNTGDDIVSCQMAYHSGYDVVEDMVCNADGGLFPISFVNIGNHIPDIGRWLLEWEIISDDKA